MRVLLFLLFPSLLFADSLRVECSADGFIANVTAARTTGSFTIWPSSAALVAMGPINSTISPDRTNTNYETQTTALVGFAPSEQRILMRFETLADSMRTRATGKIIQWDSAQVIIIPQTSVDSTAGSTGTDSVTLAMYELRSTRRFVESQATWNDWATSSAWTTPGAGSTTSDMEATLLDTTATLTKGMTVANDTTNLWSQFTIPGTSLSDTINNAGVIIRYHRVGVDDGTQCRAIYHTDDATTAAYRPRLKVYYTELDYVNFGGSDSLIAKTAASVWTHLPIFTFDISSLSTTVDLDSCRWWSYVLNNYSTNTEGSVLSRIIQMMKPTNIGDNNGTVADNGEMDWVAWDERGSGNDSNWTTAGALDDGSTCNRSDGSGDDQYNGADFSVNWSSTGWKTLKFDTLYVRKYLNGGCNNFGLALSMTASAGDVAFYKIEADEKSGSANKTWITIYYTPAATVATRGTGRFGKSTTGAYLNDR